MPQPKEDFYREKKSRRLSLQATSDIARALVILSLGVVLLLGDWLKIERIQNIDPLLRYMFGSVFLLYGGFRLYRGIWVN